MRGIFGQAIQPALLEDPATLKKVIDRLEGWHPAVPDGYDPGWKFAAKGDEAAAAVALRGLPGRPSASWSGSAICS